MNRLSALFALALVWGTPAAAMTVADVMDVRDRAQTGQFEARAAWSAMTFYLQGLTEGIVASHKEAAEAGRPTAFCPPSGQGSDLSQIFTALELAESKSTSAADAILANFIEQYPCY